jgi:hypothetical protein
MSNYFFTLRQGGCTISDPDGTDVPDDGAAAAHAHCIARELMKNCELEARSWQLDVYDSTGQCVVQVPFARFDPSLDHLSPPARQLVEGWSIARRELAEAVAAATKTMHRSQALVARSRGRPYLAAEDGEPL